MNLLGAMDNLTSVALILVCWVLAHQNSGGTEPFRRLIAFGYGCVGTGALCNVVFRSIEGGLYLLPYSILASKFALALTLSIVSVRLALLYRQQG